MDSLLIHWQALAFKIFEVDKAVLGLHKKHVCSFLLLRSYSAHKKQGAMHEVANLRYQSVLDEEVRFSSKHADSAEVWDAKIDRSTLSSLRTM